MHESIRQFSAPCAWLVALFLSATLLMGVAGPPAWAQDGSEDDEPADSVLVRYTINGTGQAMRVALDELFVEMPEDAPDAEAAREELSERFSDAQIVPAASTAAGSVVLRMLQPTEGVDGLDAVAAALETAGFQTRAVGYSTGVEDRPEEARMLVLPEIFIVANEDQPIEVLLGEYPVQLVEKVDFMDDGYRVRVTAPGVLASIAVSNEILENGDALIADPSIARQMELKLIPNDPLFTDQWHLLNDGTEPQAIAGYDANILEVWDEFTGEGINITVVDSGVQLSHPDLAANGRPDFSADYALRDDDPSPSSALESHGTSVAGVAAAVGNNAIGVTGAAFESDIYAVRLIVGILLGNSQFIDSALHQMNAPAPDYTHINTNSWGPTDGGYSADVIPAAVEAALEQGVTEGREGKGIIYLWAAGNGRQFSDNVNYSGNARSRYTIAVGATGADGTYSWYSEPGAPMLVNAPSSYFGDGITTTAPFDVYTDSFGGTSSATPLVAGVIALMLEANPDLTWRDVQHILVDTSHKNDFSHPGWRQNASGRFFNHNYGFGRIDAEAAVAAAQTWFNVPPEAVPVTGSASEALPVPDDDPAGVSQSMELEAESSFFIEHVKVNLTLEHPQRGQIAVLLTSPSGTVSELLTTRLGDRSPDGLFGYPLNSVAFWGENPDGEWTLTVIDETEGFIGDLVSWDLTCYGYSDEPPVDWEVTPDETFDTQGLDGGPFAPDAKTYTVTNTGERTFEWNVSASQPWATTFLQGDGLLEPGESTKVQVRLSPDADPEPGGHINRIVFRNETSREQVVRMLRLDVFSDQDRPKVTRATLSPFSPTTTRNVVVRYNYLDPANEPQQDHEFQWYRNGELMPEFNGLTILPSYATEFGDVWQARVRVSDGTKWSRWIDTEPIYIAPSAPTLVPIGSKSVPQGRILEFQVAVNDPDGGDHEFTATLATEQGVFTFDEENRRFIWDTDGVTPRTYFATVTVIDPDDGSLTDSESFAIEVVEGCPQLPAPDVVAASLGAFDDRIRVEFSPVAGADRYLIYRNAADDFSKAAEVAQLETTTFDDFQLGIEDAGLGCSTVEAPPVAYYYWVAAVDECGRGELSPAVLGSTVGMDAAKSLGSVVYEPALPSTPLADGVRRAAAEDELSVRLRAEETIDPQSIWAEVELDGETLSGAASWLPIDAADSGDGWVVFQPAAALPLGATISMTAGGRTLNGAAIEPAAFDFVVETEKEAQLRAARPAPEAFGTATVGAPAVEPPALEGGVGPLYDIAPEIVYAQPQTVLLPLPDGFNAQELALFYYLANGEDAGWHPVANVDGWMASEGLQVVEVKGDEYLQLSVRHAATVQFAARAAGASASILPRGGVTADMLVLALVFLVLAGAGPVRKARRRG